MSDYVSATELQTEDTASVDKRIKKSCSVGVHNQRGTGLRRHGDWVGQRATDRDISVIGDGSNEIVLTGGETCIEEHLSHAPRIGDHLHLGQEVHQGLGDNRGGVAEIQEGGALQKEWMAVCRVALPWTRRNMIRFPNRGTP